MVKLKNLGGMIDAYVSSSSSGALISSTPNRHSRSDSR